MLASSETHAARAHNRVGIAHRVRDRAACDVIGASRARRGLAAGSEA
jgi:hypothetical protein